MSRFPIIVSLCAVVLAAGLSGCGNKGPLVRPVADDLEEVEDVEGTEDAEDAEETSIDDPAPVPEVSADEAANEVPVEGVDDDSEDGDPEPPPPPAPSGG